MDANQLAKLNTGNFWKKPEGKVGKVVSLLLLAGLGIVIFKNIEWIIGLLQNTLHAIFLFLVIGALIYMILDPRLRTLVLYIYKSIMRFITSIFITIDPIGILKNYLKELREKQALIKKQIANLKGEIGVVEKTMSENEKIIQKSQKMAAAAKEMGANSQVVLNARKAGRKQNFNKTLTEVYDRMSKLYNILLKIGESVDFFIEDLEDEIQTREAEYKAIKAGHSAIKGALSIFKGLPNKVDLFNDAMDYVIEDTGKKIGEIEYFLQASESFITSIDIENQAYEMEGFEMLDQWEKQSSLSIIEDSTKKKIMDGASADSIKTTKQKTTKSSYLDIIEEWKKTK